MSGSDPRGLFVPGGRVVCALAVVAVVHCLLGIGRVPGGAIYLRWDEVSDFWRDGDVAWLTAAARIEGREAIEQLRSTTGADAIVAVRGAFKGALEYAPRLLWPRLCCFEDRLPAGAEEWRGRPIADQILIGEGMTLRLQPR